MVVAKARVEEAEAEEIGEQRTRNPLQHLKANCEANRTQEMHVRHCFCPVCEEFERTKVAVEEAAEEMQTMNNNGIYESERDGQKGQNDKNDKNDKNKKNEYDGQNK